MDTFFQEESPQILTLANPGWNYSQPQETTQHWCLWPQQYQDTTKSVRFVVDGLRKSCCSWHTQAARIMPAASLQLLLTVLKEGERESIREKITPLPSPSCSYLCICLSLGAGGEKVIFYPRNMRQKSYSLARNSKTINCNLQRLHPHGPEVRPSHRTCEMWRKENTKAKCLGAAG